MIKYEKSSGNILVGHIKDKELRTFYKVDQSKVIIDPLTDAINLAKDLSKKSN